MGAAGLVNGSSSNDNTSLSRCGELEEAMEWSGDPLISKRFGELLLLLRGGERINNPDGRGSSGEEDERTTTTSSLLLRLSSSADLVRWNTVANAGNVVVDDVEGSTNAPDARRRLPPPPFVALEAVSNRFTSFMWWLMWVISSMLAHDVYEL